MKKLITVMLLMSVCTMASATDVMIKVPDNFSQKNIDKVVAYAHIQIEREIAVIGELIIPEAKVTQYQLDVDISRKANGLATKYEIVEEALAVVKE